MLVLLWKSDHLIGTWKSRRMFCRYLWFLYISSANRDSKFTSKKIESIDVLAGWIMLVILEWFFFLISLWTTLSLIGWYLTLHSRHNPYLMLHVLTLWCAKWEIYLENHPKDTYLGGGGGVSLILYIPGIYNIGLDSELTWLG